MLKCLTKYLNSSALQPKNLIVRSGKQCNRKIRTSSRINPKLRTNCRCLYLNNIKNAKLYVETENSFAYKVLGGFPVITIIPNKIEINRVITNEDEFNTYLNQHWRSATASDITKAFLNITNYCQEYNINISDTRFDKLVDGLMDNVEKLTVDEIYNLLECLIKLPSTETVYSHNYHDTWSALDDVCCWRMKAWDSNTLFKFADVWYRLHLGRICDYVYEFLGKLARRPKRLTQMEIVHAFFYMNVSRKRVIEFDLECAIENKLSTMTINEMAIIAMGYFKTQTKIKVVPILNRMIELVTENSSNVHEIGLAAILKIIRMSQSPPTENNIIKMLDKLVPEVPRLSIVCSMHAALTGTTLQIFHRPIIDAVAQKLIENINDINSVRLKDIERLLLATTMFDYEPRTSPNFYETIFKELHKSERLPEKVQHPKCIPYSLHFLSFRNLYSEELMNEVLNPEFVKVVYGEKALQHPRELLSLDLSKDIDFPSYNGNRWSMQMRQKAAKYLVDYIPNESKRKIAATDKFILNVMNMVYKITGDKDLVYVGYILPQYPKPDIILCADKVTKRFVKPAGYENYILGDIMRPQNKEHLNWYAIVPVGFNNIARNTGTPVGMINMKKRHLNLIGYETVLVTCTEWQHLKEDEQIDYILSKIKLS